MFAVVGAHAEAKHGLVRRALLQGLLRQVGRGLIGRQGHGHDQQHQNQKPVRPDALSLRLVLLEWFLGWLLELRLAFRWRLLVHTEWLVLAVL